MYAALALEWIGQDTDREMMSGFGKLLGGKALRCPWLAEVTDMRSDGRVVGRRFIDGKISYLTANSVGSGGVGFHYVLEPGRIYEVRTFASWKREDRYLCRALDGHVFRLTHLEAWEYWRDQSTSRH